MLSTAGEGGSARLQRPCLATPLGGTQLGWASGQRTGLNGCAQVNHAGGSRGAERHAAEGHGDPKQRAELLCPLIPLRKCLGRVWLQSLPAQGCRGALMGRQNWIRQSWGSCPCAWDFPSPSAWECRAGSGRGIRAWGTRSRAGQGYGGRNEQAWTGWKCSLLLTGEVGGAHRWVRRRKSLGAVVASRGLELSAQEGPPASVQLREAPDGDLPLWLGAYRLLKLYRAPSNEAECRTHRP